MADDEDEKKHGHHEEPEADEAKPDAEEPEQVDEEDKEKEDKKADEPAKTKGKKIHHHVWGWLLGHKKISIPLAAVVLLAVLAAIPFTRYAIAGMALKQDLQVVVLDSQTNKPVSAVTVTLKGKSALTNNEGKATLHVPVGKGELSLSKRYYKGGTQTVTVTISKPDPVEVKAEATGRPVPVTVVNAITGGAVENATIVAEDTEVKTDKNGEATIVIPATKTEVEGIVTGSGYNKATVKIKVTLQNDPANKFKVAPSGKIYFLSNASGKIDLMKSNLDGSERVLVLAGTGKEDKFGTVLLASRDWKYIALLSKRDGGENAKLFLIEAENDKVTTMDEGNASFGLVGWSGDRFIYVVARNNIPDWQPKRQALKSYHAPSKAITILDQTAGQGTASFDYAQEYFGDEYILDKEVVYTKNWYGSYTSILGKQATFNTIQADGAQKKTAKGYPIQSGNSSVSIQTRPADFGEIYIQSYVNNYGNKYDGYEDGKLAVAELTDDEFYNESYPNYVVSPTGKKTFWTEYRDGKNVFFVGDAKGENGKQVGSSEDYAVYGWFTDDYLLVTRKSSELRILSVDGVSGGVENSFKIGDYYKPNYTLRGYGYGYGG